MKAQDSNLDSGRRNYSRRDHSGTDPHRYASFHTVEEAEELTGGDDNHTTHSLIPGIEANVSKLERIVMVAAGSYLLYKALSGKKKNIPKTIVGGTMLARGISGYCPAYDMVDIGGGGKMKSSNVNIRTTIVIDKPINEVYDFWRKLENLPKFMKHLESVTETDNINSEWVAKGPAGIGKLSWTAQILMDERGKLLSWHSLPGSTVDNAGKVYFRESGNGTELDITISYHAPLGVAGEAAAKLLNPWFEKMVVSDMENLKSYLETGEQVKETEEQDKNEE